MDLRRSSLAQSTPSVCPYQEHHSSHDCDDRGGHVSTMEHHGVIGKMGRGGTQAHPDVTDPCSRLEGHGREE